MSRISSFSLSGRSSGSDVPEGLEEGPTNGLGVVTSMGSLVGRTVLGSTEGLVEVPTGVSGLEPLEGSS